MFEFMGRKKMLLMMGWACGIGFSFVSSSALAKKTETRQVKQLAQNLEMLSANVQALESRMYSLRDADRDDERVIRRYYEGIKQDYLLRPLRETASQMIEALDSYYQDVSSAISMARNLPQPQGQQTVVACLKGRDSEFKDFEDQIEEAKQALSAALNSPYMPASNTSRYSSRYVDVSTGSRLSEAASSISRVARIDFMGTLETCVKESLEPNEQSIMDKIEEKIESANNDLGHNISQLAARFPSVSIPDPLSTRLSTFQVAQVLRNGSLQSMFRRLRNIPSGALQEQEIWDRIMPTCEREKEVVAQKALPWETAKKIGKSVLNDALCTWGPSWGTAKWKMNNAQMMIGVAMALHQTGLVKCDPETLQALAAQRTPEMDLKRMGFDVLKNKEYIDRVFMLLPHRNPLGMVAQTGDGSLITNIGWVGNTPNAPGAAQLNAVTRNGVAVRDPASTSVVSSGAVSQGTPTNRTAPSRGLTRSAVSLGESLGKQYTQEIKAASAVIRSRGAVSLGTAQSLRRGAENTSRMVATVNTAQDKLGSHGVRRVRSRFAASIRNASEKLAVSVTASHTVKTLKNAVRGDSGTVFGSGTSAGNGSVGQLSNTIEANRVRRGQNVDVANAIMQSIETAVSKSSEYIQKMRVLAIQYKEEIAKAEQKVLESAPEDQLKVSRKLNQKLEKIVSDLAPLYAAYNALGPAINESYSMMVRLYGSAGQAVPAIPGLAQIPGAGTIPQGFPSAFSSLGSGAQSTGSGGSVFSNSSSTSAFLKNFKIENAVYALLGIQTAIAESKMERELNWAKEWQRFVTEYETYLAFREKRVEEELKSASDLWQRSLEKGLASVPELSIDQIVANESFASALEKESSELVTYFATENEKQSQKIEFEIQKETKETLGASKKIQENLNRAHRNFLKNYPVTPDDHWVGWTQTLTSLMFEATE